MSTNISVLVSLLWLAFAWLYEKLWYSLFNIWTKQNKMHIVCTQYSCNSVRCQYPVWNRFMYVYLLKRKQKQQQNQLIWFHLNLELHTFRTTQSHLVGWSITMKWMLILLLILYICGMRKCSDFSINIFWIKYLLSTISDDRKMEKTNEIHNKLLTINLVVS